MTAASKLPKLPHALAQLLDRTVLATFRLNPPPASLGDSMAVHEQLTRAIAEHGRLVHYRQSVCPVTKERLEKLQVLVEDLQAQPIRSDIVHRGELLETALSPLERELAQFLPANAEQRIILDSATRDPKRILSLKYLEL